MLVDSIWEERWAAEVRSARALQALQHKVQLKQAFIISTHSCSN